MPDDDLFNLIEEDDEKTAEAAEAPEDGSLGERLRARRRQRGLSLFQAAQELRTDPAVLRAIEADDFSVLGAPVYIKGHLRKYAALLGLSPDGVFDDYARTHELSESMPVVNRAVDPGRPHKSGYWLRIFVMLLLIVAIGFAIAWWSMRRDTAPRPISVTPGNDAQQAGEPAVPVYRLLSETGMMDEASSVGAAPDAERSLPETASAVPGKPLRVELAFTGDSWVEITDAEGDELLFGLVNAGTEHSVEGASPIEVLLGSAGAVRLEVAGRPYDIPPENIHGGLARFSIEEP